MKRWRRCLGEGEALRVFGFLFLSFLFLFFWRHKLFFFFLSFLVFLSTRLLVLLFHSSLLKIKIISAKLIGAGGVWIWMSSIFYSSLPSSTLYCVRNFFCCHLLYSKFEWPKIRSPKGPRRNARGCLMFLNWRDKLFCT